MYNVLLQQLLPVGLVVASTHGRRMLRACGGHAAGEVYIEHTASSFCCPPTQAAEGAAQQILKLVIGEVTPDVNSPPFWRVAKFIAVLVVGWYSSLTRLSLPHRSVSMRADLDVRCRGRWWEKKPAGTSCRHQACRGR